jgi:hypothetical protein
MQRSDADCVWSLIQSVSFVNSRFFRYIVGLNGQSTLPATESVNPPRKGY